MPRPQDSPKIITAKLKTKTPQHSPEYPNSRFQDDAQTLNDSQAHLTHASPHHPNGIQPRTLLGEPRVRARVHALTTQIARDQGDRQVRLPEAPRIPAHKQQLADDDAPRRENHWTSQSSSHPSRSYFSF